MKFSMAQILNYAEKELYIYLLIKASGYMLIAALIGLFLLPHFAIFWALLLMIFGFMFFQSMIYAMIGNYTWAQAELNDEMTDEVDIDVRGVKKLEDRPKENWRDK